MRARYYAGILFTNPDRGTKLCHIELPTKSALIRFSFFLPMLDDGFFWHS
jgi:hypothetical protein